MFIINPTPITSRFKANIFSSVFFGLTLLFLVYLGRLWPEVLFAFGLSLAMRQTLRGRWLTGVLSFLVFWGLSETYYFHVGFVVIIPVLLTLAAITLTFREYTRLVQNIEQIDDFDEWEGD